MRIAKPMLMITSPVGVVWGVYEVSRFHWWLGVLMTALIAVIGGFFTLTVRRIRADRLAARAGSLTRAN